MNDEIKKLLQLYFPSSSYSLEELSEKIERGEILTREEDILPYLQTALLDEKILEVELDRSPNLYFSRLQDDSPVPLDDKGQPINPEPEEGEEEDPRAELIRRLQEYERYKQAAQDVDALPRLERDVFQAGAEMCERKVVEIQPDVSLRELLLSFQEVLVRADMFAHHQVQREPLSVRQRMSDVLERVQGGQFVEFTSLFTPEEGRMGVVVTFLSILELIRESLLDIVQAEPFAPIHIKARGNSAAADEAEPQPAAGA